MSKFNQFRWTINHQDLLECLSANLMNTFVIHTLQYGYHKMHVLNMAAMLVLLSLVSQTVVMKRL